MNKKYLKNSHYLSGLTKLVWERFSLFLVGIVIFGLLSCSGASDSTSSIPTADTTSPTTVTINSGTLIAGESAYLSFIFSEEVTNFIPNDIKFNPSNNADKGSFVTNSLQKYLLVITLKKEGTLKVTIPANSFENLHSNQNTKAFTANFTVLASNTTTHTISFKLNGGTFTSPKITTLKVLPYKPIDQNQLSQFSSYPPTGPQPDKKPVTRSFVEWRADGVKYDFATPVTSDLTLEAVWSNSCGKVETFHPRNRDELVKYIQNARPREKDKSGKLNANTNLNHIDTSAITDMLGLFNTSTPDDDFSNPYQTFNGKIGCWNTSKVANMEDMFAGNRSFDQDIGDWDVSKVTDMSTMFSLVYAFNQDIGDWDVSKVTDMKSMFQDALGFNQPIGKWDVSSVINMDQMFFNSTGSGGSKFYQDLSDWDVTAVTSYKEIFYTSLMQDKTEWHPKF